MATRKTADKLPVGARIVVRDGVDSPDFPDVSFAGWIGVVVEHSGPKSGPRYIVEWDDETVGGMPDDYLSRCEEQQLFGRMACLERDQIDPAE